MRICFVNTRVYTRPSSGPFFTCFVHSARSRVCVCSLPRNYILTCTSICLMAVVPTEMYVLWLWYPLKCICLMAGVPTEMTFNTTSTVKFCQSITVMTSQRDNSMRHDNALPVTCHSRCASHRTMHMSYRSKTYTWNDVILVKRRMIRFSGHFLLRC